MLRNAKRDFAAKVRVAESKTSMYITRILLMGLLLFPSAQAQDQSAGQSSQTQKDSTPQAPPPAQAQQPDQTAPAAQNSPDKSGEPSSPKEESTNPAQAVADKTKEVTVQAAEATKEVAQQTLAKARDWETQWLAGAYVGRNRKLMPLSEEGRKNLYLRQTLLTPEAYMKRMFAAGIDQARGSPSQWDGGWKGYGERFASREGQFISANTLAWIGNARLGYEPRYDQCRCHGFWPRTRHAIVRNFLTYDRSEQAIRPQLALYGGAFGGGLISTAWKPKPRNAFAEGGRAMLGQAGYGTLLNFFTEFAVDINRKLGTAK